MQPSVSPILERIEFGMTEIIKNMIMNISLLALIAYLLTRAKLVKDFIIDDQRPLYVKLIMSVMFGLIGILSTYTGTPVQGAIVNTRVIGVVAGGILGGPIVGLGAGVIAGLHRYLMDVNGFTSIACGVSTLAEGIIGGLFSKYIKRARNDCVMVGTVTLLAEIAQMGIILLIARPFDKAWPLVQTISLPMILFNSLGVMIFVGIMDSVFIEQDKASGDRVRLVIDIADKCLPYLRKGIYDRRNLGQAATIILEQSDAAGVIITDQNCVLACAEAPYHTVEEGGALPLAAVKTIESGQVCIAEDASPNDTFFKSLQHLTAVCAPLTQKDGEVIGTLVILIRKFKLTREVECEFVSGLAKLFSTQLELSQFDNQKKMLEKAKFSALQSQINPHFLFNSLSTITFFCREKPERARELLIVLSNYFRNTLQTGNYMIRISDEFEHINAYLELEKARFDEKLKIEEDIPGGLDCMVPSFILQPLVENAVNHGAMHHAGVGIVRIIACNQVNETQITVCDNGPGIPENIIQKLYSDCMDSTSVGLTNVHKRLKSIYGEEYGLQIKSSANGTEVCVRIPNNAASIGGDCFETGSN